MKAGIAGAVALALTWTANAAAAPPSVVGALPYDKGDHAAWVAVGAPDLELGVVWGLSTLSDLGARLRLSYGTGERLGGFGASAQAIARLRVAAAGGWDVALVAEPGLFAHADASEWAPLAHSGQKSTGLWGVDIGVPAVVASSWVEPTLLVSAAVAAPLRVLFGPEPTVATPLAVRTAIAQVLDREWAIVAGGEVGAVLYGPGAGQPAGALMWRARVGVQWQPGPGGP